MIVAITVLVCPSCALFAFDLYALHGWVTGCVVWREEVGTGAVTLLLFLTLLLCGCSVHSMFRHGRLKRDVSSMPLLNKSRVVWIGKALPEAQSVPLRVNEVEEPQAFTVGWRSPTIVLSRWTLKNLDRDEIVAAVAHELAHIRYRDNLLMFCIHSLCPGGLGLKPLRQQLVYLLALIERRADDTGALMTGDPLALASALVKVRRALLLPRAVPVPSLAGDPSSIHVRVNALLGKRVAVRRIYPAAAVFVAALITGTALSIFHIEGIHCAHSQCTVYSVEHQIQSALG